MILWSLPWFCVVFERRGNYVFHWKRRSNVLCHVPEKRLPAGSVYDSLLSVGVAVCNRLVLGCG